MFKLIVKQEKTYTTISGTLLLQAFAFSVITVNDNHTEPNFKRKDRA